jgi:chemotaxis protein CheD
MDNGHYFLQPGYIVIPDGALSISAVIGSGVSLCLYDRKHKFGGMNLFQLPFMNTKGKTTAIYGNVACVTLIRMMKQLGTSTRHLEAQLFGGARHPDSPDRDIGSENVEMARKIILKYGISLASEDVGGEKGRKVVFNTENNETAVLKVDSLRNADWYPYDQA